ncbi:hypothetical protein KW453_20890 [Vibrio fluvialis]|nr:hypothetical protein [Vibrio fluvialis]MBY7980534.1 hypothetical protein [Vibrio fluvialis]
MNKIFLGLLLFPTLSLASAKDVITYYHAHSNSEILQDLISQNTFAPPYETIEPLIALAKVCKEEFFDEEPVFRTYSQIIAKQDYLATASSARRSILDGFIQNSGGIISLYDYVSEDFIYLVNVRDRTDSKQVASNIYAQFENSPQVKKAFKKMAALSDEKIASTLSKEEVINLSTTYICGLTDLFYTVLGGIEYSNSVETLAGVKRQIHRAAMDRNMSKLQDSIQ